ncbi:MAG: hypothetical protein ABSE81_02535 [Candidatus Omnitrophota bacterium]|jgi:uncharacterized protein (DUF2461 family)
MEKEPLGAKAKVNLEECQTCGGWWYPDKEILKNGVSAEACPFCRFKLEQDSRIKRSRRKLKIPISEPNGFW